MLNALMGALHVAQPTATFREDVFIRRCQCIFYEQARRDAFNQLAAHNALMVDAEPERLGIELVNRYQAAKRADLIRLLSMFECCINDVLNVCFR